MSLGNCWILGGVRTPVAKAGSVLRRVPAYDLRSTRGRNHQRSRER